MANEQNLLGNTFADKDPIEAKKQQSKGGINSGRARREKRDLRRCIEILLETDYTDKNGKTVSGAEALCAKLFEQGMKGNVKAFETLRSTVGQDPVQKIMVSEVDETVISEVENAVLGEDGELETD